MTYSCAIFTPEEQQQQPALYSQVAASEDITDPLEQAQMRKMHRILQSAHIKPGHKLLEIGSGWGSFAIEAAKMGCQVDTITLSVEQKALAEQRIREASVPSVSSPIGSGPDFDKTAGLRTT